MTSGVSLSGGTLTNAGTIEGSSDAVQFGATAATLVVDPGAQFIGQVAANSAVDDAIVLAGSVAGTFTGIGTQFTGFTSLSTANGAAWTIELPAAARALPRISAQYGAPDVLEFGPGQATFSGLGSQITGFSKLDFSAGASWTVISPIGALDSGQTVAGFSTSDTIVLFNVFATSESYGSTGLVLDSGNTSYTLDFALPPGEELLATTPFGGATTITAFSIPTITGTQADQQSNGDAPVPVFKTVVVGDTYSGGSVTDTLTITYAGGGTLGGSGLSGSAGSYTLTGTAVDITTALDALTFTPAAGTAENPTTTTFTLTVTDPEDGASATDSTTTLTTGSTQVTPFPEPTITGTQADQQSNGDAPVPVFKTVVVGDTYSGGSITDTLTITYAGGGTLGGSGLSGSAGSYTLTGTAVDITTALDALTFTPAVVFDTKNATTTFTLTVTDPNDGTSATNTATTLTAEPALIAIIDSPVRNTVTPGSGIYNGTITITDAGSATGSGPGIDAVTLEANGESLVNFGLVTGGQGAGSSDGGNGVSLSGGIVTNDATITGGGGDTPNGAYRALGYTGGGGGSGASLSGGTLINNATLTGGQGGVGGFNNTGSAGTGGYGGSGASLSGGTLTNDATITGGQGGVGGLAFSITGGSGGIGGIGVSLTGGMVTNEGTIAGGAGGRGGIAYYATVGNGGNGGSGASLSGGTLVNDGVIIGGVGGLPGAPGKGGIGGGSVGDDASGVSISSGTLVNAGTITGLGGADAVQFGAMGGTLVVDPGAVFNGLVAANTSADDVLDLATGNGSQGTISGLGSQYTGFTTLIVDTGANWQLNGQNSFAGTATIGGTLTIAGALDLTSGSPSSAHAVSPPSSLTVARGASIEGVGGAGAVTGGDAGVYLLNLGVISGAGAATGSGRAAHAVSLYNGASFVNAGHVQGVQGPGGGGPGGDGVGVDSGATLQNSGTIAGGLGGGANGDGGTGVSVEGGTLTNTGVILGQNGSGTGGGGTGIFFTSGLVTNSSAGTIMGGSGAAYSDAGVTLDGGTLVNAGTIRAGNGPNALAVFFGGAGTLVIDPGAVFSGKVDAGANDVLGLGSSASTGTLSGLGSTYSGFATLIEDTGATWRLNGQNSFAGTATIGGTLTVAGTLDLTGGTLSATYGVSITGSLTVASGVSLAASGTNGAAAASLSGAGAYLLNEGTITSAYSQDNGAAGVSLTGGGLTNNGLITGGYGARNGGAGVSLQGGLLTNKGTIDGGGAAGKYAGTGVSIGAGTLINDGEITGGSFGQPDYDGTGVTQSGGTATNFSLVTGGSGNIGRGTGLLLSAGAFTNHGTIAGGYGHDVPSLGASVTGGTLTNVGTITGGTEGDGTSGQTAGSGVSLGGPGTLINSGGLIQGGAGNLGNGIAGGTGVYMNNGNLLNAGQIVGGTGGSTRQGGPLGGGAGLTQTGGSVTNTGSIVGGHAGPSFQTPAAEGTGVDLSGGVLQNDFMISGADGTYLNNGGQGGIGIAESGGTLSNAGTISGGHGHNAEAGGAGLSLVAGYATNASTGTIEGGRGSFYGTDAQSGNGGAGVAQQGGSFVNAGRILGGSGGGAGGSYGGNGAAGVSLAGGSFFNQAEASVTGGNPGSGSTTGFGGPGAYLNGGTLTNAGTIAGSPTGNPGQYNAAVQFGSQAGTLVIDPGAVFVGNVVANSATSDVLELAGGAAGTLAGIGSTFQNFTDLAFANNASWTAEGTADGFAAIGEISGFDQADTITIENFAETGFTFANGELVLSDTPDPVTLHFQGDYTPSDFHVSSENGATTIELCFLRGTRILTPTGLRAVEDLRIGEDVITRFNGIRPIRWIGRQGFATAILQADPARMPVRIKAGALGETQPFRDLLVSPGHSMLIGNTLVLASLLVNGITIVHAGAEIGEVIDYFQIDLGAHDCIMAEGTWSESFADGPGLREHYHNLAEFHALYPNAIPPEKLALCAPRPERGPRQQAALRPIVARATAGIVPGPMEGALDAVIGRHRIEGWALDTLHPECPVLLDIFAGTERLGSVLACDFRGDLQAAGNGSGRHAFSFAAAKMLRPAEVSALTIFRAADGLPLPKTAQQASASRSA